MRYKVDEYVVYHKGKKHSVLVFPFVKYMWAFDDWHEEDCFMVDGTVEAVSMLKYALAILVEASDKILYFPCKQEGIGRYYKDNYNLILCTPKAQLKRSSWIAIRRKLKPQNKIGSYVLQYNRKKLDDYCNNKLIERKYYGEREHIYLREEVRKEIKRKHFEDIMGENLFVVMSKEECCYAHFITAKDLDEYHAGYDYGAWSYLGWIITQKGLYNMKKELEEEMKEVCI